MFLKDWSEIDKRVALFSEEDAVTYERLVALIKGPLKNDIDRDLYITRGLLCWLRCNIKRRARNTGVESPLSLAGNLYLSSSTKEYAEAFTKLCRKADIDCQTVEGIARGATFQPGDFQVDKAKQNSFWNKVYLTGSWWPVHPYLCLKQNGPEDTKVGTANKGKTSIDDFWFLTNPEIFIITFFPDNPTDQLLKEHLTLTRSRQFMKLPFVTPYFFKYGLKLTSEESCVIDTVDGQVKISLITENSKSKLIFNYSLCQENASLYSRNSDIRADAIRDADFRKMVFMSRKKRRFMFEIRCPEVGSYHFVIRGKYPNEAEEHILLKAKIVCRERMSVFRPFPIDTGFIGWGIGPSVFEAGLYDPQVKIPKVCVTQPKSDKQSSQSRRSPTGITFKIRKEALNSMRYTAVLYSANKSDPLRDCVQTTMDNIKCELRLSVTPPAEDELALVIEARDKQTQFEPICNYLITALDEKENVEDDYYDSSDGTTDLDEEIEPLEVKATKLRAERDRWLRVANRREKSTLTEALVDDTDDYKELTKEPDDGPLIVYVIEVVLAMFAVCFAVLKILTTGAVDR